MIERLVQLEQDRLAAAGYDTAVYPSEVTVSSPREVIPLAGESWILTGVRASDSDLMGADHRVAITSPTNAIQATERTLAQLGTSIHRLFRHHIIIHVNNEGEAFDETREIAPFTLSFVRIVPSLRKTATTK